MPRRSGLPARTEDDVLAALAALAERAPDPEAVLRAVAQAGRGGPRRRLARPAAVVAAAVTAAAGLAGGALQFAGPPGGAERAGTAPAGLPSAASLGTAMMTAYNAASDDILLLTMTTRTKGAVNGITRGWLWPARPVPGQQARWREFSLVRPAGSSRLAPQEDNGFVFTFPSADWARAYGELTVVCYAHSGQTSCGYGGTDTPAGTWSRHWGEFVNPNPAPFPSPPMLAQQMAGGRGGWRAGPVCTGGR